MTDETRELFDAPWKVDKVDFKSDIFGVGSTILRIFDKTEELITAHIPDEKTANRISHLPELYYALAEATKRYCGICHNLSGQDEPKIEDLIKNGCPKAQDKNRAYVVSCVAMKWLDLLKKVRDGE